MHVQHEFSILTYLNQSAMCLAWPPWRQVWHQVNHWENGQDDDFEATDPQKKKKKWKKSNMYYSEIHNPHVQFYVEKTTTCSHRGIFHNETRIWPIARIIIFTSKERDSGETVYTRQLPYLRVLHHWQPLLSYFYDMVTHQTILLACMMVIA